jgi:hypothetical protein
MRTLSTVLIKSGSFTGSFSGSSVDVTTISSSYGYFGLNAVVNGILKVFDVVYAYAGVVGSVTGSLSGSKVIVDQLTASNFSVNKITLNEITASSISSSYIITSQLTASNGNFTSLSASAVTAQTASFNYLSINNTGSAPTNVTSSGLPGEIRFDNNFIYIYTNQDWLRVPIAKWQ